MIEALRIAPGTPKDVRPHASPLRNFDLPFYLRKSTLKQIRRENDGMVPEKLWEDRSMELEKRGAKIIRSQTDIVSEVIINPRYAEGSDMVIKLVDGFLVSEVRVEIKSSPQTIQDFKSKIRNQFPDLFPKEKIDGQIIGPWVNELIFSEWLTDNALILMNCSEYKSEKEILDESFYPQLKRILAKTRPKVNGHNPTQFFP